MIDAMIDACTGLVDFASGGVRGWNLLMSGLFKMSNMAGESFEPLGESVRTAFGKLRNSTRIPPELLRSIQDVQHIANQAANHSPYGEYDPDLNRVLEFIQECERVRDELVRIYNAAGL